MNVKSIGFVGTGAISEAMVRGLLATPPYTSEIHLSPRSTDISARLAEEFPAVRVAADNQEVVDHSEIIVLAIRPQIAEEVIKALSFRDSQSVISVIAATERQNLLDWIGAEVHLVQAIPLPFVEDRLGVTAIYPSDQQAAALFKALGSAIQCETREEYDRLAAVSALMSTYFGIMEIATVWLEDNGLERPKGKPISHRFSKALQSAHKGRASNPSALSATNSQPRAA